MTCKLFCNTKFDITSQIKSDICSRWLSWVHVTSICRVTFAHNSCCEYMSFDYFCSISIHIMSHTFSWQPSEFLHMLTTVVVSKCQYFFRRQNLFGNVLKITCDHMTFTNDGLHEQMSEFILFLFRFLYFIHIIVVSTCWFLFFLYVNWNEYWHLLTTNVVRTCQ